MIVENSKFKEHGVFRVVRICDECGNKKKQTLQSVRRGRKIRGREIDLCGKCAYLAKYSKNKPIRGEKHHSWKHGLQNGYKRITLEDGRRIREHRYVYEQFLGRKLKKEERVHHIDFDRLHNSIDNLILFKNNGDHRKCHMNSMENCALEFLNSKMWFNFRTNKYTLKHDNDCERDEIIIDDFYYVEKIRKHGVFYKYINFDGEEKFKKACVVIAEKILGRRLYQGEVVHHINGNPFNSDLSNLVILNRSTHQDAHYSLQKCTAEFLKMGLVGFDREKKEYFVKVAA